MEQEPHQRLGDVVFCCEMLLHTWNVGQHQLGTDWESVGQAPDTAVGTAPGAKPGLRGASPGTAPAPTSGQGEG